jgi:GMP synthase (glutamine-hydrolysing)
MGTVEVSRLPAAAQDPLFAAAPDPFLAQATHLQAVLRLPDGAVALATSEQDPHSAFRWGDAAWGVQFHPEFSTTHMRGYLRARQVALAREGRDPQAMVRAVSAAPQARAILRRFVREALRRARVV